MQIYYEYQKTVSLESLYLHSQILYVVLKSFGDTFVQI